MRIGDIDIKVGWSLLIIGTFISLSLATGYFPTLLPGWGSLTYLVAAILSFFGLYASVLLHELAHAFVAQKQGLKVKSIVLNLFGGATHLKEESPNSRATFWIAVVGPLTNLGLATVFFGIANLPVPSNPVVSAIALYLVGVNFLLGSFNLIPAYPLDGGQVLHALVWGRTKSQLKATRLVTKVGGGFGWVFVGLGFFLIVWGDLFDGLWVMLLGWFLRSSARLSDTQSVASPSLEGVKVGQVMWRGDRLLSPQTSLTLAAQTFFGVERGRVLPVVDQGYLLGTLSLEQLRKTSPAEREQGRVEQVMTRRGNLVALRSGDDLLLSMKTLSAKPVSYAAVIGEGGQFAGLFYLSDIPRFLEMQQLLAPVEPQVEPLSLPPTSTIKSQDGAIEDSPPQPQKLDKVA
jgi:Zn-dependent protease